MPGGEKALGKSRALKIKIYGTGPVGLIKVQMQRKQNIISLLSYEETEDKKLCPACIVSWKYMFSFSVRFTPLFSLILSRLPSPEFKAFTNLNLKWKNWTWILSAAPGFADQPPPINTAPFLENRDGSVNERWAAALGCGGAADQQPSICVT